MVHITTEHKNVFKKQLTNLRNHWKEDWQALEQQKNDLGYNTTPLKSFMDREFIDSIIVTADEQTASAIIEIQHKLKDLEDRYKTIWPEEYVALEFNKKHAIVHIDQTYVLTEKINALGRKDFTLESVSSFRAFYQDEVILCSDNKKRNKADIWLRTPKRKFIGIVFDPTTESHLPDRYNIWKGFARTPKKGSPLKFWEHVFHNICSGNEIHYTYVRKWLAYVFQYPNEVHTALVLCGSQGVGKNSFVEPFGILLGQHYVLLSSISELVSNFNAHLKNAVLIHANEALWGGNKKEIGTVKAMITEATCLIEGKGKDMIMVRNFKHLILSSNEDWPVHIDADDRRFLVLRVSEDHKEDYAYFAQIQAELDDNGYEGLLYDLLNEDLTDFNPRKLPQSNEAFSIKLRSTDSAVRYIYDALMEGYFNFNDNQFDPWQDSISRNDLYAYYRDWCNDSGETELRKNFFFTALNKYIPSIKKQRPTIGGKRIYSYLIPSLDQARSDFCKAFKADPVHIFKSNEEPDASL